MSGRLAIVVALACVIAVGWAETAAVASGFRLVGRGGAVSDGVRYAAVLPPNGDPPLVFDTARQISFRLASPLAPSAATCDLTGMGAGQALWTCSASGSGTYSSDRPVPVLTDLATRTSRLVAGSQNLFRCPVVACPPFGHRYDGVGRSWIRVDTYSFFGVHYLSRRTGEVRRGGDGPRTQPDLDRRSLVRRLCSPVRRSPSPAPVDGRPSHVRVDIDGRHILVPATGIGGSARPLRLFRCGKRRPRLLSRCRPTLCESARLSAGVVTWAQGDRVWSHRLRGGRRTPVGSLRLAPLPPGAPRVLVVHTRTRVFAVALQRQAVYVARLPR